MNIPRRLRFALSHLVISAAIILICASVTILVWYPGPLAQLEGISSILLIMAAVDAGAGPLCTLVAASSMKSPGELKRDLIIIGGVQLVALLYALFTVWIARPVYIVYNVGQFDVEHANELTKEELSKVTNPIFSKMPWAGPVYVEARFPDDEHETMRIVTSAASGGADIKDMPRYYIAWPPAQTAAREKAKPVTALRANGALKTAVAKVLGPSGVTEADAIVIPISGKTERGTVVLRKSDLAILGIIPILAP